MKLNGSLVSSSENGWRMVRCRFSASCSHIHSLSHVGTLNIIYIDVVGDNSSETHECTNNMMYLDSDCDEMNSMRILLWLPWQCKQRPFRMHGMTDRLIVD